MEQNEKVLDTALALYAFCDGLLTTNAQRNVLKELANDLLRLVGVDTRIAD